MKNIPNKIYLQVDPEKENPEFFEELETTWCSDRINDNDIPYYRKRVNVEPEVKVNFAKLLKDKIKEIQRIKDQTPEDNIMYKEKMMMGTYGILICKDLLSKLKNRISV